ncbi:MAG: DNA gyrase inhibitor YacG [Acidobacteriota bacterium]
MSGKGLSCPACGREVAKSTSTPFPFCSERCRLLDLGKWLDGRYRVAGRNVPPEPEVDD